MIDSIADIAKRNGFKSECVYQGMATMTYQDKVEYCIVPIYLYRKANTTYRVVDIYVLVKNCKWDMYKTYVNLNCFEYKIDNKTMIELIDENNVIYQSMALHSDMIEFTSGKFVEDDNNNSNISSDVTNAELSDLDLMWKEMYELKDRIDALDKEREANKQHIQELEDLIIKY